MCGILGLVSSSGSIDLQAFLRASQSIRHRGPDDDGWLLWNRQSLRRGKGSPPDGEAAVALAHRRLSILDLSQSGWQPMWTEDQHCAIVFNGEIYNYVELRRELEAIGTRFQSQSDTEVLLKGFAHWGEALLPRLVGMFAFAFLDTQRQRLTIARDPFGIKPLFYCRCNGGWAFASELKALLELPGVGRALNAQRVFTYLRFGHNDAGDGTFLSGVDQLPSGSVLEFDLARESRKEPAIRHFWRLEPRVVSEKSIGAAAEKVRALFLENVRLHLRSDVPVGAALSGGVDSSAIVMAMRHLEGRNLDIRTYSYVAEDEAINEEKWIDIVGRAAGAKVLKTRARAEDVVEDLDALIDTQDEPFGSTSIYAQYRVFKLAAGDGIKVMLDGQGADEMMAGYPHFLAARMATMIRAGKILEARQFERRVAALPGNRAHRLWPQALRYIVPNQLHALGRRALGREVIPAWINETWCREHGVEFGIPYTPGNLDGFMRYQLIETVENTSLPALLRYEDRNSMHFSLESRVPFLTASLAEYVVSLPEDWILDADGTTKSVFRRAMRGIVPDEILDRKDKIGFQTPELTWLRHLKPWVDAVLSSDTAARFPALNMDQVRKEWSEVLAGKKAFDYRIWRWLNVLRWAERKQIALN